MDEAEDLYKARGLQNAGAVLSLYLRGADDDAVNLIKHHAERDPLRLQYLIAGLCETVRLVGDNETVLVEGNPVPLLERLLEVAQTLAQVAAEDLPPEDD